MEIEALQSIFMDGELTEAEGADAIAGAPGTSWQVLVSPLEEGEEDEAEVPMRVGLVFAHTPAYPEEPPLLKVRSVSGVADADCAELLAQLEEQAAGAVGMAMVFDLAEAAKEWLRDKAGASSAPALTPEQEEKLRQEEEERRIAELRRLGTPVTKESYTAWLESYEAELALERAKESFAANKPAGEKDKKRQTGRQYFESKGVEAYSEGGIEAEDDGEDFDFDALEDDDFDEDAMLDSFLQQRESEKS